MTCLTGIRIAEKLTQDWERFQESRRRQDPLLRGLNLGQALVWCATFG